MEAPANQDTHKDSADGEIVEADVGETEGAEKKKAKRKLTPEEQMAAYEEALKDEDWGHQPC